MDSRLRFVMVLHQHQPVGNLDAVNEEIYRDAYRPLADALADPVAPPVNLHTSGSLVDWLAARHPEYLQQLRALSTANRVEILGGAYHDPILPLLSRADRRGQIETFARRLGSIFGHIPRGLWLPERIWDPALAADLADCNIEHTVLDDFHFHAAGLANDQLRGYYLTEAEGRLIALFAGDERLRYLIPFAEPEEIIAYLRSVAQSHPGGTIVYADDAEKFGAWPGMHSRVVHEQWLRRFFEALRSAADWLHVTTLGECIDNVPPLGKIYVPEGSYREMGPWSTLASNTRGTGVLPTNTTEQPAGTWRNFRAKYPEVDEMYCRMLGVSRRCTAVQSTLDTATMPASESDLQLVEQAREALYRAQCGCAYWHGIFGGVYLPHLRQAVYQNLIESDRLLSEAEHRGTAWLTAGIDDFNLDVHKEIVLANPGLTLFLAPDRGGQIYELDVVGTGTNLLATLARRREPYHSVPTDGSVSTALTAAAAPPLIYDDSPRKSLLDHFFEPRTTLDEVCAGTARELGDFVNGRYRARMRRVPGGVTVQLARHGIVAGRSLTVTKQLTLWADRSTIDLHYALTGLLPGEPYHFGVEFHFAGLPPGCTDRYFVDAGGRILTDFGHRLDMARADALRLVDRFRGLDVGLFASQAGGIWAFPVHTLSRSQRGLEQIQQSVAVLPHWIATGDADGRWSVDLRLQIEATSQTAAAQVSADAMRDAGRSAEHTMPQAAARASAGETLTFMIDAPHKVAAPKHLRQTHTSYAPPLP